MVYSIVEMSRELGNNPNAAGKNKRFGKIYIYVCNCEW